MAKRRSLRQFIRHNALSLTLYGLFAASLAGLIVTGYAEHNDSLTQHHQPTISLASYLGSGEFIEAVFENWESEFLQMWALVMLTIVLRQRGAPDSKPLRGKTAVDTSSRYSILHATSWSRRRRAFAEALYGHSLGLVLLGLFVVSFALHAVGGVQAYNQEATQHGERLLSLWGYIASTRFWFESFQNWQSEFLAVATLLVLSIFLRQRGSPESKAVGEANDKTGS